MKRELTFRVEAVQYGEFKFRLPDEAVAEGLPAEGIFVQVQLVMAPQVLRLAGRNSSTPHLVRHLEGEAGTPPVYQATGGIGRVESYVETDGSVSRRIHELPLAVGRTHCDQDGGSRARARRILASRRFRRGSWHAVGPPVMV